MCRLLDNIIDEPNEDHTKQTAGSYVNTHRGTGGIQKRKKHGTINPDTKVDGSTSLAEATNNL